jgi:hypothetical protein
MSIKQHIIEHEILGITSGGGGGDSGYFVESGSTLVLDDQFTALEVPLIQISEDGIYVTQIAGELVFKDTTTTVTTLTELKSMRNIWLVANGLAQGNITLSDATNWNAQYTHVSNIHVITTSNKWNLWIFEDNTFDTASVRSRKVVNNGNGTMLVDANLEVNSSNTNLYLNWTHTGGGAPPTVSFYITGEARRH